MSVNPTISLKKVKEELIKLNELANKYGWLISELDESNQTFTVKMISPLDQETYILEVNFSDYPELPLILEFIDPDTGERGTKHAYPLGKDSFFHGAPCICNPASRMSYKEFNPNGPHQPDKHWQLAGWKKNPKVGALTTMHAIINAIYLRISDDRFYQRKRMA